MYINEILLAVTLADNELRENTTLSPFEVVDEDGDTVYTEEAQVAFDKLYDKYLNVIKENFVDFESCNPVRGEHRGG